MATERKCALTNKILNALLLQIAPGYDEDTIREIISKFGKKVRVYIGFGRYDLIVASELPDFDLLEEFHKSHLAHVQDWFPVLGLKWTGKGRERSLLTSSEKVLGLTFVKLDVDQLLRVRKSPVQEEERIIRAIYSEIPCILFSSLGFNEILIVNQAKSFEQLAKRIIAVKRILTKYKFPVALDVSTIPAVDAEVITETRGASRLRERMRIHLFLSLQVGLNQSLKKRLKEIVGSGGVSIYGFHDVLIELSGATSEVIEKVKEIRKEGKKHGLYSSFSIIPHIDEALPFKIAPRPLENHFAEFANGDEQITFYRRWFEACRRDPMTRHIFDDMVGFYENVQRFLEIAKERKLFDDLLMKSQMLDTLRECIIIAFEQRCSGLTPGNLLGPKSIKTEPLGSIQRAIVAVESIPIFLFQSLNFGLWPGFCIYGYISRFYRTEGCILNVPYQFRVTPEMWWGIFHEVGHEIFLRIPKRLKERIIDELESLVATATSGKKKAEPISEEVLERNYIAFIEEIFAELFGFHYGFNDNWDLYVDKIWSYFAKESTPNHKHISRSALAYFALGPGKDLERDEITPEKIDECIQEIERITIRENRKSISDDEWDDSVSIVWGFLDAADIIRQYLLEQPNLCDMNEVKVIDSVLAKGEVVHSANPLEIVFSLMLKPGEIECRNRFAAVLSLYSYYCRYIEKIGRGLDA